MTCAVAAASALAVDKPPPPAPNRDTNVTVISSTDYVRLDGGLSAIRGTELVGFGSRKPYLFVGAWADMQVGALLTRAVGIDLSMTFGTSSEQDRDYEARVESAVMFPLLRRDGIRGYSLVVGTGLGVAGADRYWWSNVHGYPYSVARFSVLLTRLTAIDFTWSCAPIDTTLATDHLWSFENRFQLAAFIGLLSVGARVTLTAIQGGDPQRTYGDLEAGFFLGIGMHFDKKVRAR